MPKAQQLAFSQSQSTQPSGNQELHHNLLYPFSSRPPVFVPLLGTLIGCCDLRDNTTEQVSLLAWHYFVE
jgi:hypothetical protein